jgi:integrase
MTRRRGNITQRSPDSYRIKYDLPSNNGKRRTVTTTVQGTRKDAERELTRLLREADINEHIDPNRIKVKQWLETWLDTIKSEISPKSHERYEENLRLHVVPELGDVVLNKLTPYQIQIAYNKLTALSPSTRRYVHIVFKSALSRAVEQQLLSRNPAAALKKLPKAERKEMKTLTVEQSVLFLGAIKHSAIYGAVLLALVTGMRRGEILALRWRRVDLDRGTIQVVESLEQTKAGLRFKSLKNNKTRAVVLPDFAIAELRRLKRQQAERLLRIGIRQVGDTLVCCREDGEPKQPRSLSHEFDYFIRRAPDIPRVRFHDLRHSHATQMLVDKVHPKIAQERLGHSSIAITMDLYSHVTDTMQSEAAAKLDAAFAAVVNAK